MNEKPNIILFNASIDRGTAKKTSLYLNELNSHIVKAGFDSRPVEYTSPIEFENYIKELDPKNTLIFSVVEYLLNEDGTKYWVHENLEKHGLPVTASSSLAMKRSIDKVAQKEYLKSKGVLTPNYIQLNNYSELDKVSFEGPYLLKPIDLGGSEGVYRAKNRTELEEKAKIFFSNLSRPALVEEFIGYEKNKDVEFSIGIIGNGKERKFGAIDISYADSNHNFLDQKVKKEDSEIRKVYDLESDSELKNFTETIFNMVDARDYGRMDVRKDNDDKLYFIETNLLPGLFSSSYLPKIMKDTHNYAFSDMLNFIINSAVKRYE